MSDATTAQPTSEHTPTGDTNPKPTPPPTAPIGSEKQKPAQLPDDHPLVTALAAQKAENEALKVRAAKLDEIEESQKSEAQRAAEALEAAKSDATQARAELLRYKVAAAHGITDADDIALFLTGTDEDTLTKQATRLAERSVDPTKPRQPKPDPNQGREGAAPGTTGDMFAATVQGLIR